MNTRTDIDAYDVREVRRDPERLMWSISGGAALGAVIVGTLAIIFM